MKLLYLLIILLLGLNFLQTSSNAAVVLDSFTEGAFALDFDEQTSQFDVLPGTSLNERRARGEGVKDWNATLNPISGSLTYTVNLRSAPNGDNWFNLNYSSSSGTTNLLGVDGITLNIAGMQGLGDLVVFFGDTPGNNLLIPISGPGNLTYAVSNILTGHPLDEIPQIQFRLIARTADFSVTLNEISLVPEPSTVALAGLSSAVLLRRRRRETTNSIR